MIRQIWANMPVKDIQQSRMFFEAIGFPFNDRSGQPDGSLCMLVGEQKFVVMLFEEALFNGFVDSRMDASHDLCRQLFSIDEDSVEHVDALALKVKKAGGIIYSEPKWSMGWLYGFGFIDLDGHRWNVLFMDHSRIS